MQNTHWGPHAQDTVHFGGHGWSQERMKAKSVQSAVTEGGWGSGAPIRGTSLAWGPEETPTQLWSKKGGETAL